MKKLPLIILLLASIKNTVSAQNMLEKWVTCNGKIGFINSNKDTIIPCEFDKVEKFTGNYIIGTKGGKQIFMDFKGTEYPFAIVLPLHFQHIMFCLSMTVFFCR